MENKLHKLLNIIKITKSECLIEHNEVKEKLYNIELIIEELIQKIKN